MTLDLNWLVLLPPLVAISIAVWKRQVILALVVCLWLSEILLNTMNPFTGFIQMVERVVLVFEDPDKTRVLMFSLLVGGLLAIMKESGGTAAFTNKMSQLGLTNSPRRASLLPTLTGIFIFIETNLSILTAGSISQKLFDTYKLSRARLAFIIDSTCSPVSVLILLNGWGAYILGLIHSYPIGNPVEILIWSIVFNFYPILIILTTLYTAITGKVYGPMRRAEERPVIHEYVEEHAPSKVRYMLLPILLLIITTLFFMMYTGNGSILSGSGSRSILWAVTIVLFITALMLRIDKKMTFVQLTEITFKGMGQLLPLVTVVMLSMAVGMSFFDLGTGVYIAGLIGETLPIYLLTPLLFIAAGVMAFTTGTSWGTFAILIPIGIPLGLAMGLPTPIVLASILGGAVFGDHASPISDSTIISSLASGCDHMEHVRTQLPYALTMGGISIVLYILAGLWLL